MFTVTLAARRATPGGASRGEAHVTVRTLIVDDDVRVADIHRGYVEKVDGFAVAGVANRGTEALRRVLEDQPDLSCSTSTCPTSAGSRSAGGCAPPATSST